MKATFVLIGVVYAVLLPAMVWAGEFDLLWIAEDEDWFNAANWEDPDLPANDPDKHRVPDASENAAVNNGGTANIDSGAATARSLVLGDDGSGSLVQTGGTATISSLLKLADEAGSSGSYSLSGTGTLSTTLNEIGKGGTGVFTQDGGTHTGGQLLLGVLGGSMGTYELNAGAFSTTPPMGLAGTIVGGAGTGRFVHAGGDHHVTATLEIGRESGGFGRYEMTGGTLTVDREGFGVGVFGEGEFDHTDGTVTANVPLFVGFGSGSVGTYLQSGGTVHANDRLVVGRFEGSDGSYFYSGGQLNAKAVYIGRWGEGLFEHGGLERLDLDGDMFIGYGSTGKGTYILHLGGEIQINGTIHVSRTTWGAGPPYPVGRFEINLGKITSLAGANTEPRMFAHGANARILGPGEYDAYVNFETNPVYGAMNDQAMWIGFDRNSLTQATRFVVENGLSEDHSGTAEKASTLQARMLPDTSLHAEWGDDNDTAAPGNIIYDLERGTDTFDKPEIAIPYDPADVTGNTKVSKENIEKRMRMWQFRKDAHDDGTTVTMVINVTDVNASGTPRVDTGEGVVYGRAEDADNAPDVPGFDLAVGGLAVDPKHQDPNIAELHDRDLTGKDVKIGQVESGVPSKDHGAFMAWDDADVSTLRLTIPNAGDTAKPHATYVASILIGYDPLGVQVDWHQQFASMEPENRRYNDGFGFTGVAPEAKLWSRRGSGTTELTAAAVKLIDQDKVKIVNQSNGAKNSHPDGSHDQELTIDHYVADYHKKTVTVDGKSADVVAQKEGVIYVQIAGNEGGGEHTLRRPAGAYNVVVVGAATMDHGGLADTPRKFDAANAIVWGSSSRGPTDDGRVGLDILAQGVANLTAYQWSDNEALLEEDKQRGLYSTSPYLKGKTKRPIKGTSFAAPTVAGVASLLVQEARNMGSEIAESPLVIKSVLQTSADKLAGWEKGYLGEDDDNIVPLDFDMGAGLMDPVGADDLLKAGEFEDGPTAVGASGWDWDVIFAGDKSDFADLGGHVYLLEASITSTLTSTLNWYRHVDASLVAEPLTNLDLGLYQWDGGAFSEVELSESGALDPNDGNNPSPSNNVEHIYRTGLASGDYLLRVYGNLAEGAYEEYALSWDVVPIPEPATLAVLAIGVVCAAGKPRRRRRGA